MATTTTKNEEATPKPTTTTEHPKTAAPRPHASDLTMTFKLANQQIDDVLGHTVPDALRFKCIRAIGRECVRLGRRDLNFGDARAVVHAVLLEEFSATPKAAG